MKPKHHLQRGIIYTSSCDPIQQFWDRDRKISRDNFGRKIKPAGFIYLPGSKFHEDEVHLMMRSCLQYAVINSAHRIGKYTNKLELYRQFNPRRVKYTKIKDTNNNSCVRSVMKVTTVSGI